MSAAEALALGKSRSAPKAVPAGVPAAAPAPADTTTTTTDTKSTPTSSINIVILGGNFAGLGVLHTLARHTIPALQHLSSQTTSSSTQYQITLITPNTQFLFVPASPRALIQPDLLPGGEAKVFRPLSDAVKQYGDLVKLKQAYAYAVDRTNRRVHIRHVNSHWSGDGMLVPPEAASTVSYDVLVIATGTKARSALWSMPGPGSEALKGAEEATRREWESIRNKLRNLQSGAHEHHDVLIAGGGPVGVETAGEVASWLKAEGKTEGVKITLHSGADKLLKRNCGEGLGRKAEEYLRRQFGGLVEVVHGGVKIVSVSESGPEAGDGEGETTVQLSDGSTRTVALYIDATGGQGNADAFLPKTWLDGSNRVVTKDAFFRVRGSSESDPEAGGIYAAGDVVSGSDNTLIETNFQVPVVCSSIGADLASQILGPDSQKNGVKLPAPLKQKTFKNKLAGTLLIPIGPGGGVGQILGWGVPSFLVKVAKAKTFMVDMAEPAVTGQQWK
ncbi:hypothetical protein SMACR_08620 [Sordaria macrospora]|uniref:WGS project CABT00000000 data, contig 2.60 n=2 Tax=Sordaria macrospora TaxID=5147 RepID=F7WAE1_SORMK|nr:uncharacterized protein SMAC_08620 [Sordaria macrospora k-hell]KAA8628216.1 hypothetical protein SMACR_08620 [Sordaria macrospora]KAH7627804.1 hypothetical protein B0T09DRAFT_345188 [Sordaria sp. MPI-SDFR-AT-0083]WPJ65264.1 hypothetical protein SMAC4_08620 [Sordaria macrospora]CCC14176.1 unnamed protein product [Sordaria macrospora k-hell]